MNLEDPRGSHISNFHPETRPILQLMRQLALYSREDLLEWAMLTENHKDNNLTNLNMMTSESHKFLFNISIIMQLVVELL